MLIYLLIGLNVSLAYLYDNRKELSEEGWLLRILIKIVLILGVTYGWPAFLTVELLKLTKPK